MLTLFGHLSEEWAERAKYCKYKAGTILKALKNDEQPPRGNPFAPDPEPNPVPAATEEVKVEETEPIPSANP